MVALYQSQVGNNLHIATSSSLNTGSGVFGLVSGISLLGLLLIILVNLLFLGLLIIA